MQWKNASMINLNDVTLVGIDGIGGDIETALAMKYSGKNITFGKSILFSASNDQYDFCDTVKIDKLTYDECQKFTLTELVSYIETEYMLLVQGDGFVVNPHLWDPAFLTYDYIGAPWDYSGLSEIVKTYDPIISEKMINSPTPYQVGNGGFTLRSKKLMSGVKDLYVDGYTGIPEDAVICIGMRPELESMGCKWPLIDVAASFSCESKTIVDGRLIDKGSEGITLNISSDDSFGFHCKGTHSDKYFRLHIGDF